MKWIENMVLMKGIVMKVVVILMCKWSSSKILIIEK